LDLIEKKKQTFRSPLDCPVQSRKCFSVRIRRQRLLQRHRHVIDTSVGSLLHQYRRRRLPRSTKSTVPKKPSSSIVWTSAIVYLNESLL